MVENGLRPVFHQVVMVGVLKESSPGQAMSPGIADCLQTFSSPSGGRKVDFALLFERAQLALQQSTCKEQESVKENVRVILSAGWEYLQDESAAFGASQCSLHLAEPLRPLFSLTTSKAKHPYFPAFRNVLLYSLS